MITFLSVMVALLVPALSQSNNCAMCNQVFDSCTYKPYRDQGEQWESGIYFNCFRSCFGIWARSTGLPLPYISTNPPTRINPSAQESRVDCLLKVPRNRHCIGCARRHKREALQLLRGDKDCRKYVEQVRSQRTGRQSRSCAQFGQPTQPQKQRRSQTSANSVFWTG